MPRSNKRKSAESAAPARRSSRTPARAEPTPTKQARGASKEGSTKGARKASPSPAPTSRGRAAKTATPKTPQKGQGDEPAAKGRVTRAVVKEKEEEVTTGRGRSSTRKTAKAKAEPAKSSSRSKSGTPSKAKSTPKKKETPKGGRSRSARGKAKEEEVEESEEEEEDDEEQEEEEEEPPKKTPAKATPKGKAKAKSPAKTPSPAKKSPKTTPKPAASRSRSRGGKKGEVTSPQVVLEKMNTSDMQAKDEDSEDKTTEMKPEDEVTSPRGRRAKKAETKATPSPARSARSRRGAQKEEESTEEAKDESEESTEAKYEEETPAVDKPQETDEKEVEEKPQEMEEKEVEEEPQNTEGNVEKDAEVEESKDEKMEEEKVEDKQEEEKLEEAMETEEKQETVEPEVIEAKNEDIEEVKEAEEVEKPEEVQSTEAVSDVVEVEKEAVPEINVVLASDAVEISDEETASSTVVEPAMSEAVQISDDSQDLPEVTFPEEVSAQSAPIQIDVEVSVTQNSLDKEPVIMEVETNDVPVVLSEPVCIDGEQNGQPDSRKRKIDDVEEIDEGEAKRTCVTEILVEQVQENGEASQPSEDVNIKVSTTQYMDDVTTCTPEEDYVMVNKDDVPDSNSKEVLESLPNNPAPQSTEQTDSVKSNSDSKLGPLFNRKFIQNPSFSAVGSDPSKQFSVVSYNILAQCHLEKNDYSFTSDEYLKLEHRHQKMMTEIQYLDGDVVCLQEVGPNYYETLLEPSMKSMGYSGIMKKRTHDDFDEGEATFWKNSRFTLLKCETHSVARLSDKDVVDAALNEDVQNAVQKYLDMPDVLILTQLRCNFTNNVVTVGNIHVQWGKMEVPDIQCIQIACAIKALLNLAGGDTNPHVLCGDFNSEASSPGYQLVMEGYLSDDKIDELQSLENLTLPDGSKKALFNQLYRAFQHPSSSIKSSYLTALGKEPTVTSFNRVMRAAVDYIFYSANSLDNVGVLEVASESVITETGGIPDATFPSDHVSIKSTLSFK